MMSFRTFGYQLVISVLSITIGCTQPISREGKIELSHHIARLLKENYVFEDVGEKCGRELIAMVESGRLDTVSSMRGLAFRMTDILQSESRDKHMRVVLSRGQRQNRGDDHASAFRTVSILEGNIGYIDLRGFPPVSIAKDQADNAMRTLAGVDAMIVDLRRNGGGSPEMVQYLCSYFFDKRIHLNSLFYRVADETQEYWTVEVNGNKMPEIPLFVLTSHYTFSGGEEFCYNMQTQKRGLLIGETTGGGANPGDVFPLNDSLSIFIPTGRAINPVTQTNWEGVGVVPDVSVPAADALDRAKELARKALR